MSTKESRNSENKVESESEWENNDEKKATWWWETRDQSKNNRIKKKIRKLRLKPVSQILFPDSEVVDGLWYMRLWKEEMDVKCSLFLKFSFFLSFCLFPEVVSLSHPF